MKAENSFGFFLKKIQTVYDKLLPDICEGAKEEEKQSSLIDTPDTKPKKL